jgi:hypothetical protein
MKLLPVESNFSIDTSSFLPTPNGKGFAFLLLSKELKFREIIKFPPDTITLPVEEKV